MKCEIINPSDCCYISGEDREALSAACVLLGGGRYGLKNIQTGESITPIMAFGGGPEWWEKTFGHEIQTYFDNPDNFPKIKSVMDSFEYPGERTSMNNIGARAKAYSEAYDRKISEREKHANG